MVISTEKMTKSKAAKANGGKSKAAPAKKKNGTSIKGNIKSFFTSVPRDKKSKKNAPAAAKKSSSSPSRASSSKTTGEQSTPDTAPNSPMKSPVSSRKKTSGPPASFILKSPAKPTLPDGAVECKYPCDEIGEGWTQQVVARKSSAGKASDRYYYNPEGKKFRSMAEVNRFLNAEAGEEEGSSMGKDSSPARGRSKSPVKAKSRDSSSKSLTKKTPTKKKAPESKKPSPIKQKYAVGTTVSKVFHDAELGEERPFSGEVISYNAKKTLYWVQYEDGDEGKSFFSLSYSLFMLMLFKKIRTYTVLYRSTYRGS